MLTPRRPIRIEQKDTIQKNDWTGQETIKEWVLVTKAWAERVPLRGRERFSAEQAHAKVDVIYRLRHKVDGLTHEMRVVDGTAVYDITAIVPGLRERSGQELHCFTHAD